MVRIHQQEFYRKKYMTIAQVLGSVGAYTLVSLLMAALTLFVRRRTGVDIFDGTRFGHPNNTHMHLVFGFVSPIIALLVMYATLIVGPPLLFWIVVSSNWDNYKGHSPRLTAFLNKFQRKLK